MIKTIAFSFFVLMCIAISNTGLGHLTLSFPVPAGVAIALIVCLTTRKLKEHGIVG